jgi:hypothetical protein
MMEKGCPTFPATISITASRRQALPVFTAFIAALCYKFRLRKENDLRPAAAGDTPPVAETRWSARRLLRQLTIFQNLNSAAQL